ncbi:YlmH/Sll1252 family protein [uncultured Cetobacterium sp.]|uniref:YlmH family RNA-binding protein n=1 Tax=uncultured Cetobacterium sp. TaxID=527638 RepID=UPI0025D0DBD8|nr:YlmH/Sll1252 family protein [uncultured Cetobacterium sp.]
MNKNYFFNLFKGEDEFLIASIFEDISLCIDIDYPVYGTTFLPPQIASKLCEFCSSIGLQTKSFSLTQSSEKKLIVFTPKDFDISTLDSPVTYFKIDASNKFKTLQHKDFLGSIMSLGLKREGLGDILVKDNIGYCVALTDIYNIIFNSLEGINTIPIKIKELSSSEIPEPQFKEFTDTIPSFRLDSIIASIGNFSRNVSVNLIESGDVLVNYSIEKSKSKTVEIGSVITIRKKGKFILEQNLGENKKGKFKILIKQYI